MCGIAGQFNFEQREPVERETIVRMARSIAHRGPDDEGFFVAGPLGLGFRRLSIIDLAAGHQRLSSREMSAACGQQQNGELFEVERGHRCALPKYQVSEINEPLSFNLRNLPTNALTRFGSVLVN